jgi:hypothetical protein
LPLAEIASGAVGHLRAEVEGGVDRLLPSTKESGGQPPAWAGDAVSRMQRAADQSADKAPEVARGGFDADVADATAGRTDGAAAAAAAAGGPETAAVAGVVGVGGAAGAGAGNGVVRGSGNGSAPVPVDGSPGAQSGYSSTSNGAAAVSSDGGGTERSPGLPDIYEAEDLSLPAFVLGLEGLPTEPLHRRQAELRARGEAPDDAADPPERPGRERPTADDADPLPDRQAPDEGLL